MNLLVLLPILSPFFTAIIMMLMRKHVRAQRILSIAGSSASLLIASILIYEIYTGGIHAVTIGSWPAPFGITIVVDMLSAIMVLVAAIIGFTTSIFALGTIDRYREQYYFYPLMQVLMMGINGAFITGDIFNLYVWYEVMLISSFVLIALGGRKPQLEGALKYVTLNLLSSTIFLVAVGVTFGVTGTLNMAELTKIVQNYENSGILNVIAMLFLASFGIKAAIFPLYFWLPASYHTPPSSISAIFAGMLTKVGVYSMIRFFGMIFTHDPGFTQTVILVLAGFTMLSGVLGAVVQMNLRRLLSFHIISQIGYMVMGLGLYTLLGISGAIFYMIYHIFVKTNLFYISGIIKKVQGSYYLSDMGGIFRVFPFFAIMFIISAFALAGVPPLSGFWAKFAVVWAGLNEGQYIIVAVALITGLLTLYSMTKIWNYAFWRKNPDSSFNFREKFESFSNMEKSQMLIPLMILAALTVFMGLGAQFAFELTNKAAMQIIDPSQYIDAVFGGGG